MSSDGSPDDNAGLSPVSLAGDPAVLDAICGSAGIGLVVFGPDSTVEHVDDRMERYFRLDAESVTGTDRDNFLEECLQPYLERPERFGEFATQPPESDPGSFDCHVLGGANRPGRWLRCHTHTITNGDLAGGRVDQYVDVTTEKEVDSGYEVALENFPNGAVALVDEDLRYRLTGGELFDELPESRADIEGKRVEEVQSGDRETFVESYRAALDGQEVTVETPLRGREMLHRVLPVHDDDGKVRAAVGMTQDITDQKEHERELERTREFLTDVQEAAGIGGWEVDLRDETLYWTEEVYRIHRLSTDYEPVVDEALAFYHQEDREAITEAYERLVEDGEPYDLEVRIVTANDDVRWVRTLGQPLTDDDGDIVGARGTFQDITERKERERELRQKSRALDEAPIGITITDPLQENNQMIYANEQFLSTTGYASEEVLGRNCRLLQGPDTEPGPVATLREAIDAERPAAVDLRNYRNDGSLFWNHLEIAPVRDDAGNLVNFVGFQRDITERKQRERKLLETKERLDIALTETDTGTWEMDLGEGNVVPLGTVTDLFGVDMGTRDGEAYLEQIHPDDRSMVRTAFRTAEQSGTGFDIEFRVQQSGSDRWLYTRGRVLDDEREQRRLTGVTTDVTDRKRREEALAKRERLLRELHAATRDFYPPSSASETSTFVVEFLQSAFEFGYASVKLFDEDSGTLQPEAHSTTVEQIDGGLGAIPPGDNPIWDVYRTGESRIVDGGELGGIFDGADSSVNQALVVPVGDFGVTVAGTIDGEEFDEVDVDLVEVVTANAEAVFRGLQSERERMELTQELSKQQVRIDELSQIVDTIQRIQRRVSSSETRDALEEAVCDELVELDEFDFAWVGRPATSDTDLALTAAAGEFKQYPDFVRTDTDEQSLPARRAASDHEPCSVQEISLHVRDADWAKEAVSSGLKSVLSVPLLHDDILYGVLTVYSSTAASFTRVYENLLTDVASLSVNYSRMLEHRRAESQRMYTSIEFDLEDVDYPLQRLARETDSEIQYVTVTEQSDNHVTVIVTVTAGDIERVREGASAVTAITEVSQFGDVAHRRLSLTIREPFLTTEVRNHGGELVHSVSDAKSTEIRIKLSDNVSQRPLLALLTSRYEDIELTAKEESIPSNTPDTIAPIDLLTDRQHEVLKAAYHGGYYETPRVVTGEALADSFGISNPAIYNHLQAAHGKILSRLFDSATDINS